jgi:hypothetical protein
MKLALVPQPLTSAFSDRTWETLHIANLGSNFAAMEMLHSDIDDQVVYEFSAALCTRQLCLCNSLSPSYYIVSELILCFHVQFILHVNRWWIIEIAKNFVQVFRLPLFWDVTQRRLVVKLPSFLIGLLDRWILDGLGCPETSVTHYQYKLRNSPEERRSRLMQIIFLFVPAEPFLCFPWIKGTNPSPHISQLL